MSHTWKAPTQSHGYERRIGRYGRSLARAFIAAARIRPGQTVLDVGCGSGALTVELAGVLGAEHTFGIDPAAGDVAACTARVPGADIRTGDAEALPFEDGRFDTVLSQLVLGHLSDAERAVREMSRVARPGAAVAACVWDFAHGMTVLRAFWDACADIDAAGAARYDQARTHPYSTLAELTLLWQQADFVDVRTDELTAVAQYADVEDLWQPMLVPDGTPGRFLATLSAANRDRVRDGLLERIEHPAGPFELSARAWYVEGLVQSRAKRPSADRASG